MSIHLFVYPHGSLPGVPPGASVSALPDAPGRAAEHVNERLANGSVDVVVFWDERLGSVPWPAVQRFRSSLDDAWHAGARVTGDDAPDLLRYAQPLWIYRPVPPQDAAGRINWRLDLRAAFVRASVIRQLGGFDGRFDTLAGMARELGLRMIRRGAISRQQPELVTIPQVEVQPPSIADHYRLVRRQVGAKWSAYALARRAIDHPTSLFSDARAWRATANDTPFEGPPIGALHRDLDRVGLPERPTVSVVLPTFGRYRYVAEVLEDLRAQTIRPHQILIADGNHPEDRQPEVYERFRDLPIDLLWHEEPGICSGRNACLARATGDYVWFVDDDSRFDARNLESHLRVLAAYGADVSVGPAYMKSRPDLTPEQREIACSFMDCGTTVVRRSLLARVGGFDMQFNHHLAGEDNDIGIRFIQAGGLMMNNPVAKRFHYLAPVGGSRRKGSIHVFRRWSLRPRPVQSIYYLARRHFEWSVAWDAMVQASMTVGRRPKDAGTPTRWWRAKNTIAELAALPLTAIRFVRSARIGARMIAQGPKIPSLRRADHPEVVRVEQAHARE